jgi:hypothetical protein
MYFHYDASYRLSGEDLSESSGGHPHGVAYERDADGKWAKVTGGGQVTYYEYDPSAQRPSRRVGRLRATDCVWTEDGALAVKEGIGNWVYYTWDGGSESGRGGGATPGTVE